MRWADIPWRPADRLLRQFAGLWLLFCATLAVLQYGRDRPLAAALLAGAGVGVGTLGLVRPQLVRPLFVTWMVLVFPIGWLVLNACLALVFFGLFTPLGVVFRLLGRDTLGLRRRPEKQSYLEAKPGFPVARYYRTF